MVLMRPFLTLCFLVSFVFFASAQARLTQSINAHWSFLREDAPGASASAFDDSGWKTVNLPHTWNDKDVLPDGERGYYRGVGWYRKRLDEVYVQPGKRYFLHFEGAGQKAALYVNGQPAGTHAGGYSAFTFDITELLKVQGNIIAVQVDNTPDPNLPPLSADFTFFGGIYRDAFLVTVEDLHFDMLDHGSQGVFVSTPHVSADSASVLVKGAVVNDANKAREMVVRATIFDEEHRPVAVQEQELAAAPNSKSRFSLLQDGLSGFQLWSPDNPCLYTVAVEIIEDGTVRDEVACPLGFRWFRFDPEAGFFLNGAPLKLMGANRHQDYWGMGNALSDDQHRSDLRLLKEMGGNFIRLAHYPQDPAVLDAADRLGLLVWEETPLVNEVTLSEEHDANAELMLREMIRQHYNHPSVILWGYMNEIYWAHRFLNEEVVDSHTRATVALARRLETVAREEDPSRYTAMALHNYPLYEETGLGDIPMVVGWNLYHGWYYDTHSDFGRFMDEQHAKHPGRIHIISEYGAGSDPRLHSAAPERFDFTVEGQKRFLESFLEQIQERPYIAGAAVWNLIDFSSERRIDSNPHLNNKGLATADRMPKDPYFLFQAALSEQPVVKIAETNWTQRSGYPKEGENAVFQPVQVYANLPEVELSLNGKPLGRKKTANYSATWQAPFVSGRHVFMAEGMHNGERIRDELAIDFVWAPTELAGYSGPIDLPVNAGCNYSFFDEKGKTTWLPDKPYEPGSWGHIGGEPLYVSKKVGTKEDILTVDEFVPLYQTMRVGGEGYRFDVPDGWYEVELLLVENFPASRRFVEGIESPYHPGGERIFDILINGKTVYSALDLLKTYGYNYPLRFRVEAQAAGGHGIQVALKAQKGKTLISAIRVRGL